MNAKLVVVGDVVIGPDGVPMEVLDVEHLYEPDGCKVRQVLITLRTEEQPIEVKS